MRVCCQQDFGRALAARCLPEIHWGTVAVAMFDLIFSRMQIIEFEVAVDIRQRGNGGQSLLITIGSDNFSREIGFASGLDLRKRSCPPAERQSTGHFAKRYSHSLSRVDANRV